MSPSYRNQLISFAKQWTNFCIIRISIMKELKQLNYRRLDRRLDHDIYNSLARISSLEIVYLVRKTSKKNMFKTCKPFPYV